MRNFLPNILSHKKIPESPEQSNHQLQQQEATPLVKEHTITAQIIIQPSPYKFMIFMDKSLQVQVDKIMLKHSISKKQQNTDECYQLIRNEVKALKSIVLEYDGYKAQIDGLKQQVDNLIQVIMSKEQIIRNIENTYMEQINQINEKNETQQEDLVKSVEQLNEENQQLHHSINKLQQQNSLLTESNEMLSRKFNEIQGKHILESLNNQKLTKSLEAIIDIRGGLLNLKKGYKELQQEDFKDNNIYTLLTSKNKYIMFDYLEPKDYLNLMSTSRQMYFIIQNHRQIIGNIINSKTKALNQQINILQKENNYLTELANQAPEEAIQIGIAKFLVFKLNIGQYMNDVFNDAFELIEGKSKYQQNQMIQNTIQYQSEDLIGLNDVEPQQNATQPQGFFDRIQKQVQSKPKQVSISDISLKMQQEFKGIDKLILEALQVPFLRVQIQQTRRDMNELVKRSQSIQQQLFQIGIKCIPNAQNPQPKLSIQDFMSSMQRIFSRLLTHSHYLQLESQQLNQVCNYFAQQLKLQNRQILENGSKMDDFVEEITSLKLMRQLTQERARNLEERILTIEEQKRSLSISNHEQAQQIQQLSARLNTVEELAQSREQKINNLVGGLKQLKQDKDNVDQKLLNIMTTFNSLKHLLPQLLDS